MMADEHVVNEWLLDAYGVVKEQRDLLKRQLDDLVSKHENTLNLLADICRRNDRMLAAGDRMRDLLDQAVLEVGIGEEAAIKEFTAQIDTAIADWGAANV